MQAFLFAAAVAAPFVPAAAQPVAEGATVHAIRQKGELACGVSTGASRGMGTPDDGRDWAGPKSTSAVPSWPPAFERREMYGSSR